MNLLEGFGSAAQVDNQGRVVTRVIGETTTQGLQQFNRFVGAVPNVPFLRDNLASGPLARVRRFIGGALGSKPRALHTEFASGDASTSGKIYGPNNDIVFYLLRADKGSVGAGANTYSAEDPSLHPGGLGQLPGSSNLAAGTIDGLTTIVNRQGQTRARLGAASQPGPRFGRIGVASPLVQVAQAYEMKKSLGRSGATIKTAGLAGPYSGLGLGMVEEPGSASQFFAGLVTLPSALLNMTSYVRTQYQLVRSYPASEKFWQRALHISFQGFDHSDHSIENSIEHGEISSLAAQLSAASGGITRTKDLIEQINLGEISMTTPASAAEAQRLGPQGLRRRETT